MLQFFSNAPQRNDEDHIDKSLLASPVFARENEQGILDLFAGDKEKLIKIISIVYRSMGMRG